MFKQIIRLTTVHDRHPATELNVTPKKMLYFLHEAQRDEIEWIKNHKEFICKCVSMVSEWNSSEIPCDPFISEFKKHQKRCQFAVNLALPSRRVENDTYVMTSCINHHSGSTLKQLRGININNPAINTYSWNRLFTCWFDFGVQTNLIKSAILPSQPPMDPTELPENVLAGPVATSASASSTSVTLQPSAPATNMAAATTSKTQCNLVVGKRLPVRIPPPHPAWLSQFGADLNVPLLTTTPEESVIHINAIRPSPTRPIPSTSSSKKGSQTPTRVPRSSTRASTPSATMSAAAASSSGSQGAGPHGPVTRSRLPALRRGYTLFTVHDHDS